MCGRYAVTLPPEAVRAFFSYVEQPNFPPRYNIAPTQPIPVVRCDRDGDPSNARHFRLVRWGFVPAFVKDFGAFRPIVNARSEGLADKPSFRNAFRRRRCLVIADGFYEWQQRGKAGSQPYLVSRPDGQPFGLAGIVETWIGADGSEIDTGCIITTAANGFLSAVHDRMPVAIAPENFDLWLDPDETRANEAAVLMRPAPDESFVLRAIGLEINKPANDNPSLQAPFTPDEVAPVKPRPQLPQAQGSLF